MSNSASTPRQAFRIVIDENMCQGIGYCERTCPSVFGVDKERLMAVVKIPVVDDPTLLEQVELAEQTCPTRAISLIPVDER
jgi:sterol 14alpha-demethylase